MGGDEAGAFGIEDIDIQAPAMNVTHKHLTPVFLGPRTALINHGAAMGMPTAGRVGTFVTAVRCGAKIMTVVGNGRDVGERIGVEMLARLPLIAPALNHVETMRNHARLAEGLAIFVEVESPWIARPLGKNFEDVLGGMVAPDPGVEWLALCVRRTGLADPRMGKDAMAAVKPAVRPPRERIQRLVGILPGPAVEQYPRRPSRLIVFHRHEHEIWSRADPNAPVANLQPADEIQPLHEDSAFVENAIAVGVFEDDDAVIGILVCSAYGIAIGFRHPDATAVVQAKCDGLVDVRLPGKQFDLKALGNRHHLGCL